MADSAIDVVASAFCLSVSDVGTLLSAAGTTRNRDELVGLAELMALGFSGRVVVNVNNGSITNVGYEMSGQQVARLARREEGRL